MRSPPMEQQQNKSKFKQVFQPEDDELQPIVIVHDRTRCYTVQVDNFNPDDVMKAYYNRSSEVEFVLLTNALIISSSLASEAKRDQDLTSSIQSNKSTKQLLTITANKFKSPLNKVRISTHMHAYPVKLSNLFIFNFYGFHSNNFVLSVFCGLPNFGLIAVFFKPPYH